MQPFPLLNPQIIRGEAFPTSPGAVDGDPNRAYPSTTARPVLLPKELVVCAVKPSATTQANGGTTSATTAHVKKSDGDNNDNNNNNNKKGG